MGRGVADKALRGDAPEVGMGIQLCGEPDAASCHHHAAAGAHAALLQHLEAELGFPHSCLRLLIYIYFLHLHLNVLIPQRFWLPGSEGIRCGRTRSAPVCRFPPFPGCASF